MRRFTPTHEITLKWKDRRREVIPVMLVDGEGFTRAECSGGKRYAAWQLRNGAWYFEGGQHSLFANARRLGRGSTPKHGEPAKTRSVRVPDRQWRSFCAAAKSAGISVADWLIRLGEARLEGS